MKRIRRLAASGKVRFTLKALRELAALDVPLDEEDARNILAGLKVVDYAGRLRSEAGNEWLYVFMPKVAGDTLYVKVLVRTDCIVISFHEQVDDEEDL